MKVDMTVTLDIIKQVENLCGLLGLMFIVFGMCCLLFIKRSFSDICLDFPVLKVQGDILVLNDGSNRRYFLSGMVDNRPNSGRQLTRYDHQEMEDQILEHTAINATAMRWNAFLKGADFTWDTEGYVTGLKEGCFSALKDGLDLAEKHGILIQIVLSTCHFAQYGSGGPSKEFGGITNRERVANNIQMFSTEAGTQAYIDNVIRPMIDTLGNHKALFGYLIVNEPHGMVDPGDVSGVGTWSDESVQLSDMQRFINHVAAAIKSEQPGALLSVSGVPATNRYWNDNALVSAGGEADGTLNLYQYQYYPDKQKESWSPFQHTVGQLNESGKPVIVGEFPITGLEATSMNSVPMTLVEAYEALWQNGYSGGFTWSNITYTKIGRDEPAEKEKIDNAYLNFFSNHLSGMALDAADAPAMEWQKGHGTSYGNHVHEGMQTSDGGYIGIGQTWSSEDKPEMFVVKTDSSGDQEWQKVIGTSNKYDIGICVAEASDGFICGGGLYDSGHQKRSLVKLDKTSGDIVSGWPKYYSTSQNGAVRGIDILDDGSIVATGYVSSPRKGFLFICDDGEGFIMKTDSSGNLQWDKTLSVPQGTKVRQISGGFAVASCAWYSDGSEGMDAVLIKTDRFGNETNKYHYGSPSATDFLYDFDLTSDGGYILGGHTISYGCENWDYYLVKVNSNGVEEWHKTFGQPRGYNPEWIRDEGYGVRQTPDGGYIIAGGSGDETEQYHGTGHPAGPSSEWKAYLVKTDSSGNVQWEGVYPNQADVGNTAAEYIGLTSDGGYIVFTDTDCFYDTVGSNAFGFMKIASDAALDTGLEPDTQGGHGKPRDKSSSLGRRW